ncbi:hypothetical protein [Sphingobium yanoikuyae]|uniref:hypothetical protein n=1 Tax=Sphingobium yanoikuyae TaxID=13690 RepID=UPI0035C71A34
MSYAKRPTNWGCITAFLLMATVAFIVFVGSIKGGGGCEGRPSPCVGDYTPMWIMMVALIAVAFGLAFCINLLIAKVRCRRDQRNSD